MRSRHVKIWSLLLVLSICFNQFGVGKRSSSYGRGGTTSRGGRLFSGLGRSRSPATSSHNYGGGSTGRGRWTDRLFGRGRSSGTGSGRSGILGGTGGGILGHGHGSRHNYGANRGTKTGGLLGGLGASRGLGGGRNSMFRSSGVGSRSRANTFKNMLVGAAGGFLAYKAGKALIKNVAAPMMWNNRPYYWGSQYHPHHQPGYGGGYGSGGYGSGYGSGGYGAGGAGANSRTMCRMPIDPEDPVLGQVYMEDNTRPKEIAWSCEYSEECCGMECCPRY